VQGKDAAREIAAAIRRLDASGVDVIVVIRGGGSLEDLWCFNELAVAEAVWSTRAPVVSGVGHQTDTTLIDLVADHRAHTPTDAAQTVIPDRSARADALENARAQLERIVSEGIESRAELLERLARSRALADASTAFVLRGERLARQAQGLRLAVERLFAACEAHCERARVRLDARSPGAELTRRAENLARFPARFARAEQNVLDRRERALAVHGAALAGLSPLRVLERGYSITRRAGAAAALRSVAGLARGDALETTFADGRVLSRAETIVPEPERAGPGPEAAP
jgi:exodeoxyribonuclease VII large subunit